MRQDCRERVSSEARLQWRSEKGVACGVVILVHLLVAWAVTRPRPAVDVIAPAMELVFIQLPPPASTQAPAPSRSTIGIATAKTRPKPARMTATLRASNTKAATAIPHTVADDRWDLAAGRKQKDDGIRFSDNKLPNGYNPVRMGPPERFRMRGQASLADIVREVSKTLFWPPGYTDDPCPGLKKAVQMFSDASTERERGLLEDAVLLRSRYCN